LGATYAGLFPDRVGRMVLDGAIDPSLPARRMNLDQTAGFDTAFRAFAQDCVRREDCPLGDEAKNVGGNLKKFFKKLDARPVPTGDADGRKLGESLATTGVIAAMYDEGAWPTLRDALNSAMRENDGSGLLALSDSYYERDADGRYTNLMFANAAVNCLDLPSAFSTPDEVRKALPAFEKASPVFGEGLAWATLNTPGSSLDSSDDLPFLCRGVGVLHQLSGLPVQLRGRPFLKPFHDSPPTPCALLQPALTAAQGDAQPCRFVRFLVGLQEPPDGLHCGQDSPWMVTQGNVETKERPPDGIGLPRHGRGVGGGGGYGHDRPPRRSGHLLYSGGRRVDGGGLGRVEQVLGGQDGVDQAAPGGALAGELGAELHGAAAPGTVVEADPVDVAALGKHARGHAYAGPQNGLPRLVVPGDGSVPVEVDQE
ncbi:alpha/beta fold hydrolase, partial [Micromonospora chersina]